MGAGARQWGGRQKGWAARQRNSSLLVSARQLQALVRPRRCVSCEDRVQEREDLGFVKLGVHPIGVVMLSTGNDEQPLEGTLRRVVHTARVLWRHDGVALTRDEEHRPRS